jgi:hypothetical protein
MKLENNILKFKIFCSLLILLVLATFLWASSTSSKNSSDSNVPMIEKMKQFLNEMLQLKETTIQQRNELITKLMNIVKDANNPNSIASIYVAVNTLGEIRAVEAADLLLDMADYRGEGDISRTHTIRMPTTATPDDLERDWPFVKALINIKPPFESVIKRMAGEDSSRRENCYVAILTGTEGPDVTRYLIEKAIKKETETRKIERLNSALNMLNKDYPKDNNDVKPK